jgi:hypothetical protein
MIRLSVMASRAVEVRRAIIARSGDAGAHANEANMATPERRRIIR